MVTVSLMTPSQAGTTAGERTWSVLPTGARSDFNRHETNVTTADRLGMDPSATIYQTLAHYIGGEAGREPTDQGMRMNPLLHAILTHHGIAPLRFLRAGHLGIGFGCDIVHGEHWTDRTDISDEEAPDLRGRVCITPGLRYDVSHRGRCRIEWDPFVLGELPETLRNAMEGRLVRDVIASPATMRSSARITTVGPTGAGVIGIGVERENDMLLADLDRENAARAGNG